MNARMGMSLAVLLACVTAACAPKTLITGAFKRPNTGASGDLLAKIDTPPVRQDTPGVVGVTEQGHLFLWSFEGGLRWQLDVQAESAPLIAGPIVVTQEGDRVVARTTENGAELFVVDEDQVRLVGADSAGGLSVVAVQFQDRDGSERGMVVAARGGKIVWETELSRSVGTPAVVDGYVVVPWGTLHVSLLKASDGTEAQRVDLRDSVAGHAFVDAGNVYIGQHGLLKVDRSLEGGTRKQATYYSPVARSLPGQPGLMRDAYQPVPPPSHAGHRVRLDFRAAMDNDVLGFQDGLLYMHFYSFVFALDSERDAVRWLYQGSEDVVGTSVVPGGMYLADTAGQVAFVNALGHVTWRVDMGIRPVVVMLRPPPTPPQPKADAAEGEATSAGYQARPLQQQLHDAARLDDSRLAGGRAFAVEHLARFDGEEITEYLLSLCDDPGSPDMVRVPACRGLGERNQGAGPVLAALARRASHRDRIPAPPVGALARASASMNLKQAGPLLVAHVSDPHTPTRDLAPALDALGALQYRPAVRPIESFVRLHHAEPRNAHLEQALEAGLGALVALQGKAAAPLLDEVAADGLSMPGIAAHAKLLAEELRAPKVVASAAPKVEEEEKVQEVKVEEPKIRYLSMGVVAAVLQSSDRKLRRCLTGDSAAGARVSMIVHGEGHIERTFVTPASAQECVDGVLAGVHFPASAQGRQQVVHVIKGEGDTATKAAKRGRKAKRVQLTESTQTK